MNRIAAIVVGLLLLVLLVLFSTTYTVRFNEVAVKATFGDEAESVQREPGLHFRLPLFADRVTKYDTRLQLAETPLVEVPTADGQSVVVRAFLLWKIGQSADNVLTFSRTFDDIADAGPRVRSQLHTAVAASLARYGFDQLIGADSRLAAAETDILAQLAPIGALGVEPVAAGISQLVLPSKTTTAVLNRMQASRNKLAETERNKGKSQAAGIRAEANTVVDKLRAFADRRAEELREQGDRKAEKYYRQMAEAPELAIFLLDLEALRETFGEGTTIFMSDDAAPGSMLNSDALSKRLP